MLRFVGNGDQKKYTKNLRLPFINAKFPGKFEENIHKGFLESWHSNMTSLKKSVCAPLCVANQGACYRGSSALSGLRSRLGSPKSLWGLLALVFFFFP